MSVLRLEWNCRVNAHKKINLMLPPHSCRKFDQWVKLIYKYTLSCTACVQQQQQQQQTNRTLISVPEPVHFWLFSKYIITSVVAPTAFMSALGSSQDQLLLFFFSYTSLPLSFSTSVSFLFGNFLNSTRPCGHYIHTISVSVCVSLALFHSGHHQPTHSCTHTPRLLIIQAFAVK